MCHFKKTRLYVFGHNSLGCWTESFSDKLRMKCNCLGKRNALELRQATSKQQLQLPLVFWEFPLCIGPRNILLLFPHCYLFAYSRELEIGLFSFSAKYGNRYALNSSCCSRVRYFKP